jgi:hypothetical protein
MLRRERYNQWWSASGTPPIRSYRGYDYLGENLASYGFVAVSISANGVNVGDQNMQDQARAALINKHLAMWQQLTGTGCSSTVDIDRHAPA